MRTRSLLVPLTLALAVMMLLPGLAAAAWKNLGSTTVDFAVKQQEIAVADTAGVRNLVFEVRKAGVIFEGAWLQFEGGARLDAKVRGFVNLGERSVAFTLPEGQGKLEKIVFRCSARDGSGRPAEVTLLGAK